MQDAAADAAVDAADVDAVLVIGHLMELAKVKKCILCIITVLLLSTF